MTAGRLHLDPTICVLVDSRRSEYLLAKETIFQALHHWGVGHRIVDITRVNKLESAIGSSGVILIAQEYMGHVMAQYGEAIQRHLLRGGGLVNLDHTLHTYPADFREAIGAKGTMEESSVEEGFVPDGEHPINDLQEEGGQIRFKQPLPCLRGGNFAKPLLYGEANEPLLIAAQHGAGRLVQWLISPKIWNERYLGFAHGLDSLVWRALIWSGPKPFPLNAMPPFVRFRFDDCNGHWRKAEDFAFSDELISRGHKPSLCFCLRALDADGIAHVVAQQRGGAIDLAPHTLAPSTSLFFGDEEGEYSQARFREIFAELDETRRRWGVEWSSILSDHDHEWSRNAIQFLRERGFLFKMNITLPGERWNDPHVDWRPLPYGSMNHALGHLPEDLSDFFVVFNHHPSFETARTYLADGRFLYHRPGGFGGQKWDFLNGLIKGPQQDAKDLHAVVDRLHEHTRIGLDSLFFGGSISHSHFLQHLNMAEWRSILDQVDGRSAGWEQIPESYDEIAKYARARFGTRLVAAERSEQDLTVKLVGVSSSSIRLSLFDEEDGVLVRREDEVSAFEGEASVTVRW